MKGSNLLFRKHNIQRMNIVCMRMLMALDVRTGAR